MRSETILRLLLTVSSSLLARAGQAFGAEERERGDVPGWVMITLMSASLVALLLVVAGAELENMFRSAMDKVNSP